MHGGFSHTIGTANANFKHGRSSRYLPAQLGSLYEEALGNPDLLEMASHIALLEARMHEILGESTSDNPVPHWKDLQEASSRLDAALKLPLDNAGREKAINDANDAMQQVVTAGAAWDTTWGQVVGLMDQIRKMTDVEIKRKKDLNQLIPVERVIVLVMALSDTVKRCVSNSAEIDKVQIEFARLVGSDSIPGKPGLQRVPASVIDVNPANRGTKGGGSEPAKVRKSKRDAAQKAK